MKNKMDLSKVLNVQENINFGIRGRVGHYKVVENKLFRSFCCDGCWEEESPSMVLGVILYEVPDGIIRLSPPMSITAVDQGHDIAQGSSEGLSSPPTMSNVDAINILKHIEADIYGRIAIGKAIDALSSPWVKTADRLPTEADAGFYGQVMTCYHDEWDCFHLLTKWDEVPVGYYWYWHGLPMSPEVEK
jgi:hypothetical protein